MPLFGGDKPATKKGAEDVGVLIASVEGSNEGEENGRFGSTSAEHRTLEPYHINLIAMGGSIGTASFIYVGSGLVEAGPLSLVIAYAWWVGVIYCVSMCQMELIAFWPTDCAFSRNAGRYVDEALGFALGWNFWANEVALVAFEVTSFTVVLDYWSNAMNVNVAVYITFTFAIGKILLISGLLAMTFVTMLGGNPIHDRFGFRYWKSPGLFTTPYPNANKNVGLFQGFLAGVTNAGFTVAGPEYLSMVAGEARNPRKSMPAAFRKTVYRLVVFFVGGALAVGILVPYNSPELLGAIGSNASGAAKSPYVIAMNRLKIKVLPAIVNALILSSIYSAGNAFYFGGSRSLAQLARDGHAPKIFARRNRNGVPWVAVLVSAVLSLLAYCQVSSSAQVAITWLSGISRIMPYGAWFAFLSGIFVLFMHVFLKDNWSTSGFIYSYMAPIAFAVLFLGWKVIKKTKWYSPKEVDLVTFINDPSFDDHVYDDEKRGRAGALTHRALSKLF
ncbi:AA permease domain-containing protein [Pseudohyphozyma bogoriensis]|nr:AA permease domain-containing protein [Pseudohyphozyma bogoriensis]